MPEISRRSFFKGSIALSAGLFGSAYLAGCAPSSKGESRKTLSGGGSTGSVDKAYRTFETDVVVVGGGIAGLCAARSALLNGANVLIVDKGPFGHSGASGINWGHKLGSFSFENDEAIAKAVVEAAVGTEGMIDQNYCAAIFKASTELNMPELMAKAGSVFERKLDGTVNTMEGGSMHLSNALFPHFLAKYVKSLGAEILERTMITDILTDEDGSAAGVVGLDLLAGEAVAIRSKAVVMAMGNNCQIYGWGSAGARTNAGLECTGDGVSILMRHGVPVRNFEMMSLYGYIGYPDGIAHSQGIGVSIGDHPENVLNANGEPFVAKDEIFAGMPTQTTYWKTIIKEVNAGRGSENGGFYYDISNIEQPEYMSTFNRRCPEDMRRGLGYEAPNPVELVITPFTTAICPELSTAGETKITGLYFAGDTDGTVYSPGGFATAGGHLAGAAAARAAFGADRKAFLLDGLTAALDVIYAPLEKTGIDGVRPVAIQHMIQKAVHENAFINCSEDGLKATIAELERIRDEELPSMTVTDPDPACNNEWRQALEVATMLDNAFATAHARLARTETRYNHFRVDYPREDNAAWMKNVYVSVEGNAWTTEARDVVATYLPIEQLQQYVPEVGIE